MIPEQERYELHETLRLRLGEGPAATLMTRLFDMDPERIATKDDIAEVRGEISEVRGEIAEVHNEIAKVYGEIAQVRLENARQTRQLTLTILIAFLAQFAATTAVIVTVG